MEELTQYEVLDDLTNDSEYWWRVIATDEDFMSTISETFTFTIGYTSVAESAQIPEAFELDQNYPNPFNPITTIQYGIPEASNVKLMVYDISGHLVRTLVQSDLDTGYYTVQWNGTNDYGQPVSSGTYIARIQAGSFTDVMKMVYLK